MGALVRLFLTLGLTLTLAIGLPSVGCGGGDEVWVAATSEEFAVAWGKAVCGRRVRSCCERDDVPFDEAACAEAHANHARAEVERQAGRGIALNLGYASSCVRQIESSAPDCGLDPAINPLPPGLSARRPHCALLFDPPHGATPPGESCVEPTDCAATGVGYVSCIRRGRASTTTTCYLTVPGREGDVCDERGRYERGEEVRPTFHHCERANGLYCDADTKRCARTKPPEAPCRAHDQCVDGSYCAGCKADEPCASGLCTPYRGLDEACDPVANLFCGRGLYCNAASGLCAAAGRGGEPCGENAQCWGGCMAGACEGGFLTSLAKTCGGAQVGGAYWSGSSY